MLVLQTQRDKPLLALAVFADGEEELGRIQTELHGWVLKLGELGWQCGGA